MAAREERLTPATRNYVIFGLLFVVAVGLAIRDWVDPRERRGEADSALRLLILSAGERDSTGVLADVDGFNVSYVEPDEAIAGGRELLGEPNALAHRAAIAYADQGGFGFVALDLRGDPASKRPEQPRVDWELLDAPPRSATFAVASVGDVAVEGPRVHAAALPEHEALRLAPGLAALDGLRLSLYEHPDLARLWDIEPNAMELQARQVLGNRKLAARHEQIQNDHARWLALVDAWPAAAPGVLTGPWEQVEAAPVTGGVLLAIRELRATVSIYRKLELALDDAIELAFVPAAALREAEPDLVAARQPCEGLPERPLAVVVAPDGAAVVARVGAGAQASVYAFDPPTDAPGRCRARATLAAIELGERGLGRPSAAGTMAWTYDEDDWMRWWDGAGEHQVLVEQSSAYSGPWWIGARALALLGERAVRASEALPEAADLDELLFEPALVLLALPDPELSAGEPPLRVELGARELFGVPLADAPLIDLRPVGERELLLKTERCPDAPPLDAGRCLHRLRAAQPLRELIPALADGSLAPADALTVEPLGPLPTHWEWAVAADGSRVAFVDGGLPRGVWVADLRGPAALVPRRLDAGEHGHAGARIGADGALVMSEFAVDLDDGLRIRLTRAFVLEPAPPEPALPEAAPEAKPEAEPEAKPEAEPEAKPEAKP